MNPLPEKLFDLEILESMDDPDYTRDMIRTYLEDTPAELKRMRVSLQQSPTVELAKTAHKLKSSTAVFQSVKLVGLFETMEKLAKSGVAAEGLKELFGDIEKQFRMLEAGLKGQLAKLA
jgi:HPt (histidine-containing phosphotransfer) domain-containing protein